MKKYVAASLGLFLSSLVLSACGGVSDAESPGGGASSAKVVTPSQAKDPGPQPFNVGGFLAGNAKPDFPVGDPGEVAIVAEGPLQKDMIGAASLPVAFRNNTADAISHVDLSATARRNGQLVASGRSQGTVPAQVQPGEVGLGFIYFEDAKSLKDTGVKYEFTAETTPADTSSYNTAPLKVAEATANGASIVGTANNATGKALTGPYSVEVYCFDSGKLAGRFGAFADQDGDIEADATVSFTADLLDTKCRTFTVGVSGYFQ